MYVGEYKDGKQHGHGSETYPNGKKYIGEYNDGKKHGQGTFTYPDGKKGIGKFRNDGPWNITGYDKDGNIDGKWVHGKYVEQ